MDLAASLPATVERHCERSEMERSNLIPSAKADGKG